MKRLLNGTQWNVRRLTALLLTPLAVLGLGLISVGTAAPASADIITRTTTFVCIAEGTPGVDTGMEATLTYRWDSANDRVRFQSVYLHTTNDVSPEAWRMTNYHGQNLRTITYGNTPFPAAYSHTSATVNDGLLDQGFKTEFQLTAYYPTGYAQCGMSKILNGDGYFTRAVQW